MEPIIMFKRKRCTISRKAEKFLTQYDIPYESICIDEKQMDKETLLFIIQSVEEGLDGVLKLKNKLLNDDDETEKWGFDELLNYLIQDVKHQEVIKTPILVQGEKVIIGSKEDELRTFLPRNVKKQLFTHYLNVAKKEDLVG